MTYVTRQGSIFLYIHIYGRLTHHFRFCPLWTLRKWPYMVPWLAKPWPHSGHFQGFSPVWTFMWSLNLFRSAKPFLHIWHGYFFLRSSVWAFLLCRGKCLLRPVHGHSEQMVFSWVFMWYSIKSGCLIISSQPGSVQGILCVPWARLIWSWRASGRSDVAQNGHSCFSVPARSWFFFCSLRKDLGFSAGQTFKWSCLWLWCKK